MEVELEHGRRDPATNVTGDDPLTTGKIALAHLREIPDYYTRLARMEAEAEAEAGGGDSTRPDRPPSAPPRRDRSSVLERAARPLQRAPTDRDVAQDLGDPARPRFRPAERAAWPRPATAHRRPGEKP